MEQQEQQRQLVMQEQRMADQIEKKVITASYQNKGAENGNFCALSLTSADSMADVVMVGFAGLEGSVLLAQKKEEDLKKRYASSFIKRAAKQSAELVDAAQLQRSEEIAPFLMTKETEAAAAGWSDVCGLCELGRAGVFMGLWNIAQAADVGLEIILQQIPVKQETIEICNFFDINPYQLQSGNSWILFSHHGNRTVQQLAGLGIAATVIGLTMANHDRVIINGEERRFLEKRYQDPFELLIAE